ncbi:collagenase-like PrtC family protease [Paenibacillus eucommiae]|uniref:Collagenase-like PrtC family protease n=2 Tax=Paenibacillus eucommiae TaxID=1355755 RepID=A0ABS4J769_9BACL|nr:collagenase-like PrtC family protease [Paenibacillus eucommiae]
MQRGLFLIEQEGQDQLYPVYEDGKGTYIMNSEDVCMLDNLRELIEGRIDCLKIEGLPLVYFV